MPVRVVLAALLSIVVLLAGCVGHGDSSTHAETLVLRYTLIDEDGGARGAEPGPHCSRAVVHAHKVRVAEPDLHAIGDARPLLVVLPVLEGNWASTGSSGFARALPHAVDPRVEGDDRDLGRVSWEPGEGDNGTVLVSGKAVTLPYSWVVREPGKWRAEATLSVGPSAVEAFDPGLCI